MKKNKIKVTYEQVEYWLGTSNPEEEAIQTLVDIANGEYKPKLFKKEVLELKEE
jgi:hypothetical protein